MTWKEREEAARMLAEEWATAGKDDLDAEAAARRMGRALGVLHTARAMLRRGIPAERVAAGLGLSPEAVRRFAAGPDGGPPPEDEFPRETWEEYRDRLRHELGRLGRAQSLGVAEGQYMAGWKLILAGFSAREIEFCAGFASCWTERMIQDGPEALRRLLEDPTLDDGPQYRATRWEMDARYSLSRMEAEWRKGFEIGRKKGRVIRAIDMLKEGVDAALVSKYTEFPLEKILRLQKGLRRKQADAAAS